MLERSRRWARWDALKHPAQSQGRPAGLHHRDFGGEGSPAIVILHGMLGSSRNWTAVGRELSEARRVYALDLRNHGMSPHADSMTYEEMAQDVVDWLDGRGLPQAEIVGHSMGGKVAMALACRQPGRVSRLVVVDIAPRDYHWPAHRAEFAAMLELDLGDLRSRAEAEMRMEGRVGDWAMRKFIATNLERTHEGAWRWQVNLPVVAASLGQLERNPLGEADRYAGPALFIAGAKSGYVRAADRAAILRHFPLARIETLGGCGHNPHIEAREALVRAVLAGGGPR